MPPFVEDSHLTTDPVSPVKLSVPLLAPEQTVASASTDPPFEAGFTFIVTVPDWFCEHEKLSDTLTKLYTNVPAVFVGALIVIEFPEAVVTGG